MSLDPRYRLPLANKADIDALREEKFQSLDKDLPELDEFLCTSKTTEQEDEVEQTVFGDGESSIASEHEEFELEGESDDEFANILKGNSTIESDCCIEQGDKQLEMAYAVAMETAFKVKETKLISIEKNQDLQEFIMKVFDEVSEETREKVMERASKNSSGLQLKICCKVIRGTSKGFKGKSEPFCRLGLLKDSEQNRYTDIVKSKNLSEWKSEGLVTDDKFYDTKPAATCQEPEWNQEFELTVTDLQKECLVIEVWKGERFIGRLFHRLRSVLLSWEEKTMTLHSHSEKHERGSIILQLSIKAVGGSIPVTMSAVVCDHQLLTHVLVDLYTKGEGRHTRWWNGLLPEPVKELLKYHAFFNNIDDLQRAYVKLSVLLSYHKLYKIEIAAFSAQFEEIRNAEKLPHQDNPSFSPEPELVVGLFDLEREISTWIEDFMKDSRRCSTRKIMHFKQLYSFSRLTDCLPMGSCQTLDELVKRITTDVVTKWFLEEQYRKHFTIEGKEIEPGRSFQGLMKECADQLQKGLQYLHPFFMQAGINFFSHFYTVFDKLISAEGETRVCRTKDLSIYPVYCSLREIENLRDNIGETRLKEKLYLVNYISWFERSSVVTEWIEVVVQKCKRFIANSVADNKPVAVTDAVKYSTSAHHTESFLQSVVDFWKGLRWPEPRMSSCYAAMTTIGIADCATYYVSQSAKELRLSISELFDERGHFSSHEQLSIFLNNVDHIRGWLAMCGDSKYLDLPSFYDWLEEKETSMGTRCKCLIEKYLVEVEEDISFKIDGILLEIVEKIVPHLKDFLHKMMDEGSVAADDVKLGEFYVPLMDYLTDNLKIVVNLHPDVVQIFLSYLWQRILACIEEEAQSKKDKGGSQGMYGRLFKILTLLRDLLYQEGDGLSKEKLETKQFTELHSKLEILDLPSDKLACRYLSELTQLQRQKDETDTECEGALGKLHFSVVYFKETSTIEVNVLDAINPPNYQGTCNCPCVQASLIPSWMFPNAIAKTKVQKEPQNPQIFNEELKLSVSRENMSSTVKEDSLLLLTTIFKSSGIIKTAAGRVAGVCVVPLRDIPQLQSPSAEQVLVSEDENPLERKVLRLCLFRPTCAVRSELESRASRNDPKAKQIIKDIPVPV